MQHWLRENMAGVFMPGMGGGPSSYGCQLRAFSAVYFVQADTKKIQEIQHGGKAILPASILDHMLQLNNQQSVMLFKVMNPSSDRQRATHCGVLEFSAEEGRCYLPQWIMLQLGLEEGDDIRLESVQLPKATYAKLKPQSLDFLHITNPRAMLEVELRKWACLTKNDRIRVVYNDQPLELVVQDLKPQNAVCIIECDVNLEFDAPEGYQEPSYNEQGPSSSTVKPPAPLLPAAAQAFTPFGGGGMRLDGKTPSSGSLISQNQEKLQEAEIPAPFCITDYQPGQLGFVRYDYRCREVQVKEKNEREKAAGEPIRNAFTGSGATIRKHRY
ncbi:unnamed protein product, partial [Mesorhabditis belari]|uniref:Ubiquitin fusion degradaton protein n=1 Tax=Mesorhabditis belari TaxID=2138241 RepID=A0AAF3ETI4_9BILA